MLHLLAELLHVFRRGAGALDGIDYPEHHLAHALVRLLLPQRLEGIQGGRRRASKRAETENGRHLNRAGFLVAQALDEHTDRLLVLHIGKLLAVHELAQRVEAQLARTSAGLPGLLHWITLSNVVGSCAAPKAARAARRNTS